MFDISGRHALVTGGTSGIGAAIAAALAEAGCHVTAAGLAPAEGACVPPATVTTAELDVTDAAAIDRLVGGLDRLDILVNAAGIIRRSAEYDLETFAQVVDVNLTGTMRVCSACRPLLADKGRQHRQRRLDAELLRRGPRPAYSASKGGMAQLTKSLAIAWAADGIRVNAIAPGWIATPLTQALQDDPARSEAILSRTPMKRWGTPGDLAGSVMFLCSPAAAFVTGVILPVDGGYLIS